jgi:hypothetical protein
MSTTFRFTPDQISTLTQLRDQGRTIHSYTAAYQYILDILDPPGIDINAPRDNDAAVGLSYNWFVGARQVNEGSGSFATLIIEFTQRQAELRYGETFSAIEMQDASNEVAERVLAAIIEPQNPADKGLLPDINQIANFDATASALALFERDTNDTALSNSAAWPGAMLFPILGSDQSWRLLGSQSDNALNSVDDMKNVLFAYESIKYAANQLSFSDKAALIPVLGDMAVQRGRLG